MKIDRINYGIYIIDYYDGNLTPEESAKLLYFLSQNPDLEEEFNSFEHLTLPSETSNFMYTGNLKKDFKDIPSVTEHNFDEFCIAYSENDLDESASKSLMIYLEKHPEKKKDFERYQNLRLESDESIYFPDKINLKKQPKVLSLTRRLIYIGAAAAAIAILIAVYLTRNPKENELKSLSNLTTTSVDTAKTEIVESKKTEKMPSQNLTQKKADKATIKKSNAPQIKKESEPASTKRKEPTYIALSPIQISHLNSPINPSEIAPSIKIPPVKKETPNPRIEENSLAAFLRNKVASIESGTVRDNLNVWTLAQAGVKGINMLTESDVQLERKLSTSGKTSSIAIESETFSLSAPLKK